LIKTAVYLIIKSQTTFPAARRKRLHGNNFFTFSFLAV
jgi:hypothetical protein